MPSLMDVWYCCLMTYTSIAGAHAQGSVHKEAPLSNRYDVQAIAWRAAGTGAVHLTLRALTDGPNDFYWRAGEPQSDELPDLPYDLRVTRGRIDIGLAPLSPDSPELDGRVARAVCHALHQVGTPDVMCITGSAQQWKGEGTTTERPLSVVTFYPEITRHTDDQRTYETVPTLVAAAAATALLHVVGDTPGPLPAVVTHPFGAGLPGPAA